MSLDVLTPVAPRRRRRRRYRLRRLAPLAVLALIAAGAGMWLGRPDTSAARTQGTPGPSHSHSRLASLPKTLAKPAKPLVLLHGPPQFAGQLPARVLAPEGILVDAGTGRVLWARRAHARRPVASLTKIMTAVLALREVPWHAVVTVRKSVTEVPLVREGLRTGEQVPAWKLFYAMLLYSGNDDAAQLAISSAGTQRAFLAQMNAEAQRLGMHDSHFTSPSGVVDQGNYSTPWDLAALTRYALRNARFRHIVRTQRIEVSWAPPTNAKIYVNNNWLLREYAGADGVKTGFTHAAGWCLAATATRHGRTLIAVLLDSGNMYADAKTLLDFGFGH